MSAQRNVFSALQPERRANKTGETAKNAMFASFVNNPSTSAWGDDSDDDMHVAAAPVPEESGSEESEESESDEDEEEEESEEEKPMAAVKTVAAPTRTLSKKERKELEMKEFEAALADLGMTRDEGLKPTVEKEDVKRETEVTEKKKKKKRKGRKPVKGATESDRPTTAVVDIKAVLKTKTKKKKTTEPTAVRIAREEKAKNKNKSKKDKSSFNEFSI